MIYTKKVEGTITWFFAWDEVNKSGIKAYYWDEIGFIVTDLRMTEKPEGESIDMMEFYMGCVTASNKALNGVRSIIVPKPDQKTP
jgi:hypothetical protein